MNTSYVYDNFGNIVKIHYKGDVGNSEDDKYEHFNYLNNSEKWIVNKPINYTLLDFDEATKLKETLYTYDNLGYGVAPVRGSVTSKEDWLDIGENPVANYSYDIYGNLINETDAKGHTTQYIYGLRDETHTFVDQVINAKNHRLDYSYGLGTGNLLWERDANGQYTNYTYDVFGRITQKIFPYDSQTYPTLNYSYEFDGVAPESVVVSSREQSGSSQTFDQYSFYDGFEKIIQSKQESENQMQIVVDTYYDSFGRVREKSNPYFADFSGDYTSPNASVPSSIYSYDVLDRVIRLRNPDNTSKTTSYDYWNLTEYNENNQRKDSLTDAYGQIILVKEYNNGEIYSTQYEYNKMGNLVEIFDEENNTFTFDYDSLGREISIEDPDLGNWSYVYDSVGNLITQTDARGKTLSLNYDELNRLLSKNSSGTNDTYLYDTEKNNTLSQITTGTSITVYHYDNRLRKIAQEDTFNGLAFFTNWTYDARNRVLSSTLPDGEVVTYTYGDDSHLEAIQGIVDLDYNQNGQISSRTYANNLSTNYSYNSVSLRLQKILTADKQNLSYTYDNVSNVKTIVDSANSKQYSMDYDDLNRLIYSNITNVLLGESRISSFIYDAIGNILNINSNKGNITFGYDSSLAHAPTTFTEIGTIEIKDLKLMYSDNLSQVFGFFITNLNNETLSNVSWTFDTGEDIIASQFNTTLLSDEQKYVVVEYNYTSSGNYTVIARAEGGGYQDTASLEVEI